MNEPKSYDRAAIFALDLTSGRRPWQLLMTSTSENLPVLSAETNNALTRIFELFPHLTSLTVQTTGGDMHVGRDFWNGYTTEVDRMISTIFQNDPAVTGIVFPTTSTRPEQTATHNDPHWSPDGKALAAIDAALKAGEISSEEAIRRMKQRHSKE